MRDHKRRVSIVGLLQAAAALTVVFSVLTGLDIPHRNIELFSHFRLQYLVSAVVLLIVFAFLRNTVVVGILAAVTIFNASFVLPWYSTDQAKRDGTPLKLVHANVHSDNTDYDRLLAFIGSEQPDIFFLQEVTEHWEAGTRSLLQDYPYSYVESRPGNFGIAVFSKTPFDSIRHIDSPPFGHPTILAKMTVDGEPLTIISSHPTIPVGARLYEARNQQLDSIVELVNQLNGKLVLTGDFNDSLWGVRLRQLQESTNLRNVRKGFGVLPSWPTFLPVAMIPIDHALVTDDIGVSDVRTGKSIGSDHLPLVVTLSL